MRRSPNLIAYAHMVRRAIDRAYAAAETIQAKYCDIEIEVSVGLFDESYAADPDNLPSLTFFVRNTKLSNELEAVMEEMTATKATMIATLASAVAGARRAERGQVGARRS